MSDFFYSVIIPTYNHASTIGWTIGSVLGQNFPEVEIIVIDDGSKDNTPDVVGAFESRGVQYIRQDNAGPSAARNLGASMARGWFLIFLDADDWLSEGYFRLFREALSSGTFDLGLGFIQFGNDKGKKTQTILPMKSVNTFSYGVPGSFVISRELFSQMGGYDARLFYSENTDLFLRMELERTITVEKIAILPTCGICKLAVDHRMRNIRYLEKKYASMKYFLEKHNMFFQQSPKYSAIFNRIYSVSAFENGHYKEARKSVAKIIRARPSSIKNYLLYGLYCIPSLGKLYYRFR